MYKTGKNRWNYSTKSDKRKFVAAMHIISLAVVIQLLIYEILPEILYTALYEYLDFYYDVFKPGFFESAHYDEINYIIVNIVIITTAAIASLVTGTFIILCVKTFADPYANASAGFGPAPDIKDKISFKFILPKNTFALLAAGLCIVQFSVFIYTFFSYIMYFIFGISSYSQSHYESYFPYTVLGIVLYFISVVIIPSFFEEFVFRYVMLNSLRKYGNTFAIIVTSLLFGFAHARMSAFVYATAVGFFSAYIAIKTKSIWFPIILHAVVNGTSFLLQYLSARVIEDEGVMNIFYFSFLTFISAVTFIYLLSLIIKRRESGLAPPGSHIYISKVRKFIFFFNAATLIFFILSIIRSLEDYFY